MIGTVLKARWLLFTPLALALAACGTLAFGVENPTPTSAPTQAPTNPPPAAVPTDPPLQSGSGTVAGSLCYPSEVVPEMTLYFQEADGGLWVSLDIAQNQTAYTLELPAGQYVAYAWLKDHALGGSYSNAVVCGLNQDCTDHNLAPFDVGAGQVTEAIDICDWYGGPGSVPEPPQGGAGRLNDARLFSGLIYHTEQATFAVNAAGEAEQLASLPLETVSPDGRWGITSQLPTDLAGERPEGELWRVDLMTGEVSPLVQTEDRLERLPHFWPASNELVIFYSQSIENRLPESPGEVGVVRIDGGGYRLLAPGQPAHTLAAASPLGGMIAYDNDGRAWIHEDGRGNQPFPIESYGLSYALGGMADADALARMGTPAWAPGGGRIAWTAHGFFDGQDTAAILVFDLAGRSASRLDFPVPLDVERLPPYLAWSPDGQWLAAAVWERTPRLTGLYVFPAGGGEPIWLGRLGEPWQSRPTWSPDGRWLAFTRAGTKDDAGLEAGVWLADARSWTLSRLEAPPEARLIGWLDEGPGRP